MSAARRIAGAAIAILCSAPQADAQTSLAAPGPKRFTVSAGLIANGGYELGDRNAELRGNSGTGATTFTLFHADGAMERVAGFEARFAYALSRALSIEVGGTTSRPDVNVTIEQDVESSGTTLVAETLSQYSVDVGGLFKLPWPRQTPRLQPYVIGGAGYLRQLHEDRLLVETGHTIFGGGGVQYAFRTRGYPLGVRAEARLVRRVGGIDFEDKSRSHPSISAMGFIGF